MKTHKRLTHLLKTTFILTQSEAEGAIRGAEAEAVVRCGGREAVIRRAMGLRHYVASADLLRRYPSAKDVTVYCLDKGYTGKRRVLIHDGRVVSHGHVEWHVFAKRLGCKAAA